VFESNASNNMSISNSSECGRVCVCACVKEMTVTMYRSLEAVVRYASNDVPLRNASKDLTASKLCL
jgi:hypothetical protein